MKLLRHFVFKMKKFPFFQLFSLINSSGCFGFVFIVWTCLLEPDPAAPCYTNLSASGPKSFPDCEPPSSVSATSQVRGSRKLLPQWRSREGCADFCQDQWSGVRHLLGFFLPCLCLSAVLKGLNVSYETLSLLSTAPPQLRLLKELFSPLSFQNALSHSPSLFCCFSQVSLLSLCKRAYACIFPTKPPQEAAVSSCTLLSLLSAGTWPCYFPVC